MTLSHGCREVEAVDTERAVDRHGNKYMTIKELQEQEAQRRAGLQLFPLFAMSQGRPTSSSLLTSFIRLCHMHCRHSVTTEQVAKCLPITAQGGTTLLLYSVIVLTIITFCRHNLCYIMYILQHDFKYTLCFEDRRLWSHSPWNGGT